jgi:hypothetical protein
VGLLFLLEHEEGNAVTESCLPFVVRRWKEVAYEPNIAQSYLAMNSNRRSISPNSLQLLETFQVPDGRRGNTEGGL